MNTKLDVLRSLLNNNIYNSHSWWCLYSN